MQRLFYHLTDTGTDADTGVAYGYLSQIRYTADTGGTLEVTAIPDPTDTGQGFVVYSGAVAGPGQGTLYPRGLDTGSGDGQKHPLANEKLRVKFTAQTTSTAASDVKVWVYLDDC